MSVKRRVSAIIFGLLILVGCAWFVADAMGFEIVRLESTWTFILIALGFAGLFAGDGILFSLGLMLLGGGILARDNGWLGGLLENIAVWQMIVAILLLVIGLSVLGSAFGLNRKKWKKHIERSCTVECGTDCSRSGSVGGENSVIFGEEHFDYTGQAFRGLELNGIFGSALVDLRDAVIPEDCTIEANAVFGSVEIITGSNANYTVSGSRVFGGVNDRRKRTHIEGLPTVTIDANAVFGSVEVN